MIIAKQIHKYYDELHVLKGVDLTIEKGEDCFYCWCLWSWKNDLITDFRHLGFLL